MKKLAATTAAITLFFSFFFPVSIVNAKCGDNSTEVVTAIYQQLLERKPDPSGLSGWKKELDDEFRTVRDVVKGFSGSDEFRNNYIKSKSLEVAVSNLYRRILAREPDADGLAHNVNRVKESGFDVVINYFINSPEYTSKFGDFTVPGSSVTFKPCYTRQVRNVIAYANNDFVIGNDVVERKSIPIPENCIYVNHSTGITTANPQEENGQWKKSDGVLRRTANDRITDVWVEVRARNKNTFGATVWIGVQLNVEIRCKTE